MAPDYWGSWDRTTWVHGSELTGFIVPD